MIPVCEPSFDNSEFRNVIDCMKSGRISGYSGKYIDELEKDFADYCGTKYAVAVSNCGSATLLTLEAMGIGKGDEVIVNTFTMAAPLFAIVRSGATPVLVDIEPETWNMDAKQLEAKITKNTQAILVAHVYGHPANMKEIVKVAYQHGLLVIEDAAEVLGAEADGFKVGGIGTVGNFSLYTNKVITSGEGGMIVTDDEFIAKRIRLLKTYATDPDNRFTHEFIGFNFRMTNLQAAVGCAQFKKLEKFTKKKIMIGNRYTKNLKGLKSLTLPKQATWAKHCYWVYGLLCRSQYERDILIGALHTCGVETRKFFVPMHQQPCFLKMGLFKGESYPISEDISKRGLYLPNGVNLTHKEIDQVCDLIIKVQSSEKTTSWGWYR